MDYETFRRKMAEGQKNLEAYQTKQKSGGYKTIPSSAFEDVPIPMGTYDSLRDTMMNSVPVPESGDSDFIGPPAPVKSQVTLDDIGMGFADLHKNIMNFGKPKATVDPLSLGMGPINQDTYDRVTSSMPKPGDDDFIGPPAPTEEMREKEKEDRLAELPAWKRWGHAIVTNDIIKNVNDKFDAFMHGALDTATFGLTRKLDKVVDDTAIKLGDDPESIKRMADRREELRDTTTGKVGEFAGYFVPGAAIDRAVVTVGGAALKSLPKITQGLVRGSVAGTLDSAAQEAGDVAFREGEFDPLNVALGTGLGGALGAAVPAVAPYISKGFKSLSSSLSKNMDELANTPIKDVNAQSIPTTSSRIPSTSTPFDPLSIPAPVQGVLDNLDQVGDTVQKQAYVTSRLKDVDEQLESLVTRADKGGTYTDEMDILFNERGTLYNYANTHGLDVSGFGRPTLKAPSLDDVLPNAQPTGAVNPLSQAMRDLTLPTRNASSSPQSVIDVVAGEPQITTRPVTKGYANEYQQMESDLLTKTSYDQNDIRLAEVLIKRLQDTTNKAKNKASSDLHRAVTLAETLSSQLTKSGQSIEAANVWHALSPDAYIIALDRNLERVNKARFGPEIGRYKAMTQAERDSALAVANVAQSIGEHLDQARSVYNLLTLTPTRGPLNALEQKEVRNFLSAMQKALDSGALKKLKDADVVAYRQLIDDMGRGASEADQDFLRSTLPTIIRLGNRERKLALQDMQAIKNGHDMLEFRLGRKLATTQYINLLFNVPTQLRNIISNELMYAADRLAHTISVPFDMTRSALTGRKREIFWKTGLDAGENFFSPLGRDLANFKEGAELGGRAGWNGVNPEGLTSKYEIGGLAFSGEGKYNIMGKTMNFLERTLGAAMKGADHGAFNRAYQKRLEETAYAEAQAVAKRLKDAGSPVSKDYVNQLTQSIMQRANSQFDNLSKEYGLYMTLQDDTKFARGLVKFRRGLNSITGSKEFGIGSIIMPFAKIPANIAMRAIDYSPIGVARDIMRMKKLEKLHALAKSQYDDAVANGNATMKDVFNKNFAERALSDADWKLGMSFGRALVGTGGLGATAWWLADKGLIWGSESKDMNKRKYDESQGKDGFQVNISGAMRAVNALFTGDKVDDVAQPQDGDIFMSYEYFLPVMFPVAIAANIHQSTHANDAGKNIAADVTDNVGQTADFLLQSSPLRGVRDVFNVNSYGDKSTLQQVGENLLQSATGQVIPSMAKQANTTADNKVYETYDPDFTQSLLNRLQSAAPLSKDGLPQRVTTFGDPMEKEFNKSSLFSPLRLTKFKETDATKFLNDILDMTGNESLVPRTSVKTLSIPTPEGSRSMKLTGEEFTKLQEMTGKELTRRLLMIDQNLPLDQRVYAVKNVINDAGTFARNTLLHGMREDKVDFSGLKLK